MEGSPFYGNFISLAERRKELPTPNTGLLYVSSEDIYAMTTRRLSLRPGSSTIVGAPLPKQRGARELLNFSTVDLTLRSNLGQLGLATELIGYDPEGMYIRLENHGDYDLRFEEMEPFALGRLYAPGKPLTGEELVKAYYHINAAEKYFEYREDVPVAIRLPIRYHYVKVEQPKAIYVSSLPRGTQRVLLHYILGLAPRKITTPPEITRPTEIVATDHVTLDGGYAMVVCDDPAFPHGPSKVVSQDTDNIIIGEYFDGYPEEMVLQVFKQINC